MSWLELADNSEFLARLFPASVPSLEHADIHELVLERDGPTLKIRFDLANYAEQPPPKWRESGHNTVQLTLTCIGLTQYVARGWETTNIASITVEASDERISLSIFGQTMSVEACFEFLRVESVSAYFDSNRQG